MQQTAWHPTQQQSIATGLRPTASHMKHLHAWVEQWPVRRYSVYGLEHNGSSEFPFRTQEKVPAGQRACSVHANLVARLRMQKARLPICCAKLHTAEPAVLCDARAMHVEQPLH